LRNGMEDLREQYKNKVVCGLDFGKLYEEFPRL